MAFWDSEGQKVTSRTLKSQSLTKALVPLFLEVTTVLMLGARESLLSRLCSNCTLETLNPL